MRIRWAREWSIASLGVAAAGPGFLACGGGATAPAQTPPNPYQQYQQGPGTYAPVQGQASYGPSTPPPATASATAPPPPGTGSATPPLGQILTDPKTWGALLQQITGAPAGTLTQPSNVPDALEAGLKAQQMRLAPTMAAEGQVLKQTLAAGQHATMMVPMQAGKCYVVIGFSQPGDVKDLDLFLMTGLFGQYNLLTAQDTSHNNAPFIASDSAAQPTPMCPTSPIPLQYKLDVFARDGAGAVAVQVFSKPR